MASTRTTERAPGDQVAVRSFQVGFPLLDDGHDWSRCEEKLNALPSFVTEIDGLDIHFIHVRSSHPGALPPQLFSEEMKVSFESLRKW